MSDSSDRTLEFQCPKCAKRLKASAKAAGKKFNCPACGQSVKVPGIAPSAAKDDDWLNLDEPATEPVRPKPSSKPQGASPGSSSKPQGASPGSSSKPQSVSPSSSSKAQTANPGSSSKPQGASPGSSPKAQTASPDYSNHADSADEAPEQPTQTETTKRSIFDDDLPQLAELEDAPPRSQMPDLLGVDMEELVPVKPKAPANPNRSSSTASSETKKPESSKKAAALDPANAQYRCACPSCGTPQYVTPAKQGKLIRCPDCFSEFKVPPPPPGWKPTTPASIKFGTDLVDASPNDTQQMRSNAEDLLRSAEKELDDDDIDSMYDMDFDNASFMQRTFGFVYDSTAMFQIAMYSVFFAMLFAAEFYCLAKTSENMGYALFAGLCIPMLAIIVAFPMFGTALALLESVANGQSRVREWQGFNFFDHIGEMMLFAMAAAASALPGFIVGGLIAKGVDNALVVILATMLTWFLTFPIILLSMLDNESMVNPFSADVLKSLGVGSEAWGTYYFKTFIANFIVFALWGILLKPNPVLSAIGGLLFPLLFFFTIQQLGVLAFDISEHLSFVVPDKKDDEEVEQVDRANIDDQVRTGMH